MLDDTDHSRQTASPEAVWLSGDCILLTRLWAPALCSGFRHAFPGFGRGTDRLVVIEQNAVRRPLQILVLPRLHGPEKDPNPQPDEDQAKRD